MKLSWKKEYKKLIYNFEFNDGERIKEIYLIDLYWQMMEQHVNFLIEI